MTLPDEAAIAHNFLHYVTCCWRGAAPGNGRRRVRLCARESGVDNRSLPLGAISTGSQFACTAVDDPMTMICKLDDSTGCGQQPPYHYC
jgi:hypothetical protein